MSEPTKSSKIVLMVDDDPVILKMMKAMLEIEGYVVLTELSGAQGLEVAKKTELLAVLLDLHIAGEDSFEILKRFKSLKPLLPVIIVTGSHDEEEARKTFELGAWDYVTKPIDFNYLKNILLLQSNG